LSDLMTLFFYLGCFFVFLLQTDAKSIPCFQKQAKLIQNRFSRSKVHLTRVWELLTRRWNAWHWESHCVFTAGGERVKKGLTDKSSQRRLPLPPTNPHAHAHPSPPGNKKK
jgi:hypothetical protein